MGSLTAQVPPLRTRRRRQGVRNALVGVAFVVPIAVLFVIFRAAPAVAGVLLSFFQYGLGDQTPSWKGLHNFQRLFHDVHFWSALRVTLVYTVIAVPTSMIASLALALLTRRAFYGVRVFRSIFFLPYVTSLVLAGVVFTWIFSDAGVWSRLLGAVGLPDQSWLGSGVLVLPAIAMVTTWAGFGYGMLIILARLQDVPRDVEEAALTDGAGALQRFRWVVLPELRPALFFIAVITTAGSFQVFDAIYVMTAGGPVRSSYTLVYLVYDQGFRYLNFSYAAAAGVVLFAITLIVTLVQRLTIGKE